MKNTRLFAISFLSLSIVIPSGALDIPSRPNLDDLRDNVAELRELRTALRDASYLQDEIVVKFKGDEKRLQRHWSAFEGVLMWSTRSQTT